MQAPTTSIVASLLFLAVASCAIERDTSARLPMTPEEKCSSLRAEILALLNKPDKDNNIRASLGSLFGRRDYNDELAKLRAADQQYLRTRLHAYDALCR